MILQQRKIILFALVALMFSVPFVFASCKKEQKSSIDFKYDPETIPTLSTDSVTELISDSGIIRYKIITPLWNMYDQAKEKYWDFPKGVYLEQFDTTLTVVLTLKADSAWNYVNKKLWYLKGNVFVKNKDGVTFTSEELYWDSNPPHPKIYSNKLVTIDEPGRRLLIAEDFISNQQMTAWEFSNVHNSMISVEEADENGGGEEEKLE
ncbi:MAG: LPS export ABC transporter periplasmic protein LptC [Dysgonomonas sp.]|nr:LPS export ABC transporter periplasmic protein LptC [Dysgonomonas sp.]